MSTLRLKLASLALLAAFGASTAHAQRPSLFAGHAKASPTRVVIDVRGVGYEAWIPLSTFGQLPDEGKTVALRIYTHVREDALVLYGFASEAERAVFELLLHASGVDSASETWVSLSSWLQSARVGAVVIAPRPPDVSRVLRSKSWCS